MSYNVWLGLSGRQQSDLASKLGLSSASAYLGKVKIRQPKVRKPKVHKPSRHENALNLEAKVLQALNGRRPFE